MNSSMMNHFYIHQPNSGIRMSVQGKNLFPCSLRSLPKSAILLVFCTIPILLCSSLPAKDVIKMPAILGPVKAMVSLEPAEPLIGDVVTLQIEVFAEQDVELLMPVFGEALDRFAILDFVPSEKIDDHGQTVATQKYRLQPPLSGKHSIPPILIEFVDRRAGKRAAPEGLDAYELLTPRIDFFVKSVLPKNARANLKPPLGKLEPLAPPSPPAWPWILATLIVLAGASPFLLRTWNNWRSRSRRRSAYEIARSRLERLLKTPRPDGESVGLFFVELSGIVRRYLEDRFELRAPELTTEEFLASVSGSSVLSQEHQRLLRQFLRQADLVKFAGLLPSPEDIENSLATAGRFLDETRENAPLIEVDPEENDTLDSQAMEAPVHG